MPSPLTLHAFAALLLSGGVFATIALAGAGIGASRSNEARWLTGLLTVALAGYGVFWCGFFRPVAGNLAAWVVLGAAGVVIGWRRTTVKECVRAAAPVAGVTALFVFAATGLLLLYPAESISATAEHRFYANMPGDNDIPRLLAELIHIGDPMRILGGDWLTSDRPPLQTGVALLGWPLLSACGLDLNVVCSTAGIWFQALWIPAMTMLLRALGLPARAALGVTAALGGTGFLVFNTVFVWPKLGAAAFVVMAFVLWTRENGNEHETRTRFVLGAACVACGWLSHGGVMFSLLALAPWVLWNLARHRAWRTWAQAAGVFLLLATPWLLYQKLYAPPGNRLVKWHIAGVVPVDSRTVTQALRDHYREVGWRGAWDARVQNLRFLGNGDWRDPVNPQQHYRARREADVVFPLRTVAAWGLGLFALPWLCFARRRVAWPPNRLHVLAAAWLVGGLLVWVGLMFSPNSVYTHQGSYVTQLLLLGLLGAWAWMAGRIFFGVIAAVQWIGFVPTWIGSSMRPVPPLDGLAAVVAVVCAVALLAVAGRLIAAQEKAPDA